ncbi:hypothetical protein GCM10010912_63940 [Paenibacillus albidus]|uniref:Uncharacterized protein n=1 Tax=Paenibacillus albidus TaxID=2041023 RepID=A0A917FWW4_9BACL|nr:hypothetical protein GCM10010912_63940 [Paenibacillus albidus]
MLPKIPGAPMGRPGIFLGLADTRLMYFVQQNNRIQAPREVSDVFSTSDIRWEWLKPADM